MRKLIFILILLIFALPVNGMAQESGFSYLFEDSPENPQPHKAEIPFERYGGVKNSFYFMKDDGEFSDEEKDEEAIYIYHQCLMNTIQNKYYDCGCIAGQFREARDAPDLVPQSQILSKIYSGEENKCANTTGIAGTTYNECLESSKIYRNRETEENNQKYCQCVANETALGFQKNPKLHLRHIEKIKLAAMSSCTPKSIL